MFLYCVRHSLLDWRFQERNDTQCTFQKSQKATDRLWAGKKIEHTRTSTAMPKHFSTNSHTITHGCVCTQVYTQNSMILIHKNICQFFFFFTPNNVKCNLFNTIIRPFPCCMLIYSPWPTASLPGSLFYFLFYFIIDCWIKNENQTPGLESGRTG